MKLASVILINKLKCFITFLNADNVSQEFLHRNDESVTALCSLALVYTKLLIYIVNFSKSIEEEKKVC